MNDHTTSLAPEVRHIQYQEVRSFRVLSERMRRNFSRVGYALAGLFATTTAISLAGWTLFPNIVHDVIYLEHDRSTGWIGLAIGVHDAPSTFGEKEAHAALNDYIKARERYIAEIEQENEKRVQAMSTVPVWHDYLQWLATKSAPKKLFGASGGHVDIFNLTFGKPLQSTDRATISYSVRYNRREVRSTEANDSAITSCDTDVAFQWHPEMIYDEASAQLNPYGLTVLSYTVPKCA